MLQWVMPSRARFRRATTAALRRLAESGEEGQKAAMKCMDRLYGGKTTNDEEKECTFQPAICRGVDHVVVRDEEPWWQRLHTTRHLSPYARPPGADITPKVAREEPPPHLSDDSTGQMAVSPARRSGRGLLRTYFGDGPAVPLWLDL
eukprot:GHVS01009899.1.p1 GENE.GHVS01009899.1~~GHVS01009899.1.p1  ORF type:complete len:147 (-),score=22.45 GHVS01009899.1:168-608(-)